MKRLSTKVWVLFVTISALSIGIITILSYYFYESIYVAEVQQTLEQEATNFAVVADGTVTDAFIEEVDAYNQYATTEIFAVRNPRELSACLPFEIDYDALISGEDRQRLVNGEVVVKRGYQSRFDRDVLSVIYPIKEDTRLNGILYSYVPLSPIRDFLQSHLVLVGVNGGLLFILFAFISRFILLSVLKPLHDLQKATEDFAQGNYSVRVDVHSSDEIGTLSTTFNQMAEAVETEDQRKKQFLATVSHELRTPLSSLVGYSQSLQQGSLDAQHYPEVFQLLASESARMKRLTEDLLAVARNEDRVLAKEPLVAAELVHQTVRIVKQKAEQRTISLLVELDDSLIIEAEEQAMMQILVNLVDNAIAYSIEGKSIHIRLTSRQNEAIFEIEDEGVGIAPNHLPHITERFYRVNEARTRSDGGSGLGLTIVKQLIEASGGKLEIFSELEKGTTVKVTVPLWKEEKA